MNIFVTGGSGFIGAAFVRLACAGGHTVTNFDKLTYAGNQDNLSDLPADARYRFVRGDICDSVLVARTLDEEEPDAIVHLAAESPVGRTILCPDAFIETNVRGTFTLLEAARSAGIRRFLHASTDEVYGSLESPVEAEEDFPLQPSSPYSASKAASDLLVLSYFLTYRLPVIVTRASNNYGPNQFPEKLIPLMISNALAGRRLPIFGDGKQVRDWLYVDDHCRALLDLLEFGREGEIYNIGGICSFSNLEIVRRILAATSQPESLIEFVRDQYGHDRRYALSSGKLALETGWLPLVPFESGLRTTVEWYRSNPLWTANGRLGAYREYYSSPSGNLQ